LVKVKKAVWVSRAFPSWTNNLHELSLTLNMIEIAEEHARRENATIITSVTMEIGALSGVVPEAMEFAFEACSKETLADGATLEIRRIPALGHCQECGQECAMESLFSSCTACDSFALKILKGQEMALVELEID
jgi:hydrogenase nickel incorporation protein HypA/HybF